MAIFAVRCTLAEWQNLLERAPLWLSETEANDICDTGYRYLNFARMASLDAIENKTLHWHATPKLHVARLPR